jgi:GNAT superfamily N-acetyltransferase
MTDPLEACERAALQDVQAAAPDELRGPLGIACHDIGTAYVSMAAKLPASAIVLNRTIGLGYGAPATREEVEAIVRAYAEAGVARYFVHLHPEAGPPELEGWLAAAGLEKARGWARFRRGREAPPQVETALDIRPAIPADAPAVGRIVADGFDLGAAAAPWIGALIGRPNWHVFVSTEGDRVAGCGSLFVHEGVGWLDWGATDPAYRRRGSQSALLARRIAHALDLGCQAIATETGEAVPGDPQHSYNNIVKMGLDVTYVRGNYAPPRT